MLVYMIHTGVFTLNSNQNMDTNPDIIKKLFAVVDRPFYLYDKSLIQSRINDLTSINYKNTKLYAATMANSNVTLLDLYRHQGLGVFVNSIKHFNKVKKVGFSGREIIWTSTGMTKQHMNIAIEEDVILNLDSINQLKLYGTLKPHSKVGVRINIGNIPDNETYAGVYIGSKSRIGILPSEFNNLLKIAENHDVSISGLHVYFGTQIYNIDYFEKGINLLLSHIRNFKDIEYIDFGGGLGISDENRTSLGIQKYNRLMSETMNAISKEMDRSIQLILEPGRIIAGDAGIFATRVTDVKIRSNTVFIFVEGSSAIFPRPLFYPDQPNHPHYVIDKSNNQKYPHATICGSTTYSRDFLAKKSQSIPRDVSIGDILIFKNAGSYSYHSKTDFLGVESPLEILIDKQNYKII